MSEQNVNLSGSSDFEVSTNCLIGSGAFGIVVQARNSLDQQSYALKIIRVAHKKELDILTDEMKVFSSLKHKNVVGYNSCGCLSDLPFHIQKKVQYLLQDSFVCSSCDSQASNSIDENSSEETEDETSGTKLFYLYIQMELCKSRTLQTEIDGDLYKDKIRSWSLLLEILDGIEYIHEKGIIHGDLKPSNIFLGFDNHIKIGDFGLARKLQIESDNGAWMNDGGTALYIPPDIKKDGKVCKANHDHRRDMYAYGIIVFESSVEPFGSESERICILGSIRDNHEKLLHDFRLHSEWLSLLVCVLLNPCDRPTASQLKTQHFLPCIYEQLFCFDKMEYHLEQIRKTWLKNYLKTHRVQPCHWYSGNWVLLWALDLIRRSQMFNE